MRAFAIGLALSLLVFVPQGVFAASPVADANGPYEGVAGQAILFDGSGSSDADGDFLSYSWDFGDGTTGFGALVSHTYIEPRIYTVTLTVSDGMAESSPATTQATVKLAPPKEPVAPENGAGSVAFPLVLKWEKIEGTESSFYQIVGMDEAFLATEETDGILTSGTLPQAMIDALSQKPQPYETYIQKCKEEKARECTEEEVKTFIKGVADVFSPKPYEEYKKQCEKTKGDTCSEDDIQQLLVREQTYSWRVKMCTVQDPLGSDDASCGPWSGSWSFVYTPQPPEDLLAPSPRSNVALPVFLEWSPVENINSYLIDIRVDTGCSVLDRVVGFFFSGFGVQEKCNPANLLVRPLFNALHDWFGIGEGYDPSCPWSLWNKNTEECVSLPILPRFNEEELPQEELLPEYQDAERRTIETGTTEEIIEGQCVFSKNTPYVVSIASCLDKETKICGEWSRQWKFTTGDNGGSYTLDAPRHIAPEYKADEPLPVVGKNDSLQWEASNCTHYVKLFISKVGGSLVLEELFPNYESFDFTQTKEGDGISEEAAEKLSSLWDEPSDLNQEYAWNLQPCWRIKDNIDCGDRFSDEWYFKTIGEPPFLEKPKNGETIKVPGQLSWQQKERVEFYKIQAASDEKFENLIVEHKVVQGTSFAVRVEDGFRPDQRYWWQVAVCADETGEVCGEWSDEEFSFRTVELGAPTNPTTPVNGGEFSLPGTLRWKPDAGANYYKYFVEYASLVYGEGEKGKDIEETRPACADKVSPGSPLIPQPGDPAPITSQTSFFLGEHCRGQYIWGVRSCADKECEVASEPVVWSFTAIKETTEEQSGLVPCAKTTDHTNTPYDETEPCEFKHIGFLIQNVLDFALWKLSLLILAVLATLVAANTYFGLGDPARGAQLKTVFRSYFYGVLILLFAWAIVNITLGVFGFDVEFFGRWYELPF